jgi:poly-beta-1,6-N-acetyl-D-glucosamine synthase
MKVFAIIPAHNEREGIEKTIMSIIKQSYPVEKIVIACDNCTDNTKLICEKLSMTYSNIDYFTTINNRNKKSGALNQAYDRISNEEWDFLLQVDADSILDENLVAAALREFSSRPKLGGICARFRIGEYVGVLKLMESTIVLALMF